MMQQEVTIRFSYDRLLTAMLADLTDTERAAIEGMGDPSMIVSGLSMIAEYGQTLGYGLRYRKETT